MLSVRYRTDGENRRLSRALAERLTDRKGPKGAIVLGGIKRSSPRCQERSGFIASVHAFDGVEASNSSALRGVELRGKQRFAEARQEKWTRRNGVAVVVVERHRRRGLHSWGHLVGDGLAIA